MISYEKNNKSDFIDFNKGKESKICFTDGFNHQPYICNRCHNFSMAVQNLSNFFICWC